MCVIIVGKEGKVADKDTLTACQYVNDDGIGVAWATPNGLVAYRKGITFEQLLSYNSLFKNKGFEYIIHFRFATIGEAVPRLCHPFPVTANLDEMYALSGAAKTVMAHNGTWRTWELAFSNKTVKRLQHQWSDSAIIAWLLGKRREVRLSNSGYGNRIVLLGKEGTKLLGDGWKVENGINYSNLEWQFFGNYDYDDYEWEKRWGQNDNTSSDKNYFDENFYWDAKQGVYKYKDQDYYDNRRDNATECDVAAYQAAIRKSEERQKGRKKVYTIRDNQLVELKEPIVPRSGNAEDR